MDSKTSRRTLISVMAGSLALLRPSRSPAAEHSTVVQSPSSSQSSSPALLQAVDITSPLESVLLPLPTQYLYFDLDIIDLAIQAFSDTTGNDYISFAFSEDGGNTYHCTQGDYQTTISRFYPPAVRPTGIMPEQFFDSLGSGNFLYATALSNNGQPDYLRARWRITPGNHATVLSQSMGPYVNGYTTSEIVQCRLEASTNRQNAMLFRLYGSAGALVPQPFPQDPRDLLTSGHLRLWGYS